MNVAVIGGGITGITLGYYLSQQGVQVQVFEAAPTLGGLSSPIALPDNTLVDRFHHAIFSTNKHLRKLCTELDIADQLQFQETTRGFFHNDKIYPMNTALEFLRAPSLGLIDRSRLALTTQYVQSIRDWTKLEGISAKQWLTKWSGQRAFENIWRPILNAKFDDHLENMPATYIWAYLKWIRAGKKERQSGYLTGGYNTLFNTMTEKIESAGGNVCVDCPVQSVIIEQNRAQRIRLPQEIESFDAVVVTLPLPQLRRLLAGNNPQYDQFLKKASNYFDIICPLLVLDRPLINNCTLNIPVDSTPFSRIIETKFYLDPQKRDWHYLVYLPKYTVYNSDWQQKSDEEIEAIWLQGLETLFPHFDRNWIRYFIVNRARTVEPQHKVNGTHLIPNIRTPIDNLYLVTTTQIYPDLINGESITQHAQRAAQMIFEDEAQIMATSTA